MVLRSISCFLIIASCLILNPLASLHTEDTASDAPSLVDYINGGIPRVHDTVSILSGAWVDQACHAVDKSAVDPYQIGHAYSSNSIDEGTLADGWEFFHPSEIDIIVPQGINNKKVFLTSYESGGAPLQFQSTDSGKTFAPEVRGTGFIHISSINAPNRNSPFQTKISWNQEKKAISMKLGNGTKRVYEQYERKRVRGKKWDDGDFGYIKYTFRLKKEISEAQICKRFVYDSKDNLSKIDTLSSKGSLIASVSFTIKEKNVLVCRLSDGTKVRFYFKSLKDSDTKSRVITSIQQDGKKEIQFSYSDESPRHIRRVEKKYFPNGRSVYAKFYPEGNTVVEGAPYKVESSKKRRFLKSKVRELYTKNLPGERHEKLSHAFYYKQIGDYHNAVVVEEDGYRCSYVWNSQSKRPRWQVKKDPRGKSILRERVSWARGDAQEGQLRLRTLFDEDKTPIFSKEWKYDKQGNVTKEIIRGVFTRSNIDNLVFDKDTHRWKEGGEALHMTAEYDKQGRKISEVDTLGVRVSYTYTNDGRGLISKKLLYGTNGVIIRRHFYKYDDESPIVIAEISDDGCSDTKENLQGVTGRIIKKYALRKEQPSWGVPLSEKTYVWTPEHGKNLISEISYDFDVRGRVVGKRAYGSDRSLCKTTSTTYDEYNRPIATVLPDGSEEKKFYDGDSGLLHKIVSPKATVQYKYDLQDRIIAEETFYPDGSHTSSHKTYDFTGRKAITINERGHRSTILKDNLGRVIEETFPKIIVNGEVQTPITKYAYSGQTVVKTLPNGAQHKTKLNAFGKPLKITSPKKGTTSFKYDARAREIEKNDNQGYIVLTEYDDLDQIVAVREVVGDEPAKEVLRKKYSFFGVTEEITPGLVKKYSYDAFGRVCCEEITDRITGHTAVVATEYDTFGRVSNIHNVVQGTTVSKEYDICDRLIKEETRSCSTNAVLARIRKEYDRRGNPILEATLVHDTGCEFSTKYEYGAYNKLSRMWDSEGNVTTFHINLQTVGEGGLSYLVETIVHPDGTSTQTWKDSCDTETLVQRYDPFQRLISKRCVKTDILGKPTRCIDFPIDTESGEVLSTPSITLFEYDSVGNCVRMIRGAESPYERITSYRYDAYSRKTHEKKPSNVEVYSSYDVKGRLSEVRSSDNTIHYQYRYDSMNNPSVIKDCIHHETVTRKYSGLGGVLEEIIGTSDSTTYNLDALGRIVRVASRAFSDIHMEYQSGTLQKIRYKDFFIEYGARKPNGVLSTLHLNNQLSVTFSYDTIGRPSGYTIVDQRAQQIFQESRTAFSPTGLLLSRSIQSIKTPGGQLETTNEIFTYDPLGQLTSDNGDEYRFDSLQRAVMLRGKKQSFSVLHELQEDGYVFDVDGRRVKDSHGRVYTYDAFDRLTQLEHNDGTRGTYTYDALCRRVSRTSEDHSLSSGKKEERFLFIGENEIGSQEKTKEGYKLASFRVLGEGLGAEIGASVLIENHGEIYFPFHDLSGHIRGIVSAVDNSVIETYDYSAFSTKNHPEAPLSPWTFSSKRLEENTSFFFFGRRIYDTHTVMWLTLDPLGFNAGPNLYAYVKNNPLTSVDLYGLLEESNNGPSFYSRISNCVKDLALCFTGECAPPRGRLSYEESNELNARVQEFHANRPAQPFYMYEGERVYPGDHKETGVYLITREGVDFFEKFSGQTLANGTVSGHGNGMITTFYEALKRAYDLLEFFSSLHAVVLVHNSTEGFFRDASNAALSNTGYISDDVVKVRAGYEQLYDKCAQHGIKFKTFMCLHSESAGILFQVHNMLKDAPCSSYFGKTLALGPGSLNPGFRNVVVAGDVVPHLNILKYTIEAWKGFPNTDFINLGIRSPSNAHGFDNPCYQRVLYEAVHIELSTK